MFKPVVKTKKLPCFGSFFIIDGPVYEQVLQPVNYCSLETAFFPMSDSICMAYRLPIFL